MISATNRVKPQTGLVTNQKVVQGATTHVDLTYDYLRPSTSSGRTGQLTKIVDNLRTDGKKNRHYTYDNLGRLQKARGGATGTQWSQTYSYDQWGNRLTVAAGGQDANSNPIVSDGLASVSYDNATNRITSTNFAYDAAGNQKQSNENGLVNNYKYDAAGRLAEVSNSAGLHTYGYGASNQRLQSVENSTTTLYTWAGGSVIAEYDSAMNWTKSYVYLGGRLLATDTTAGVQYQHPDRLGTRLVTNTSGGVVSENVGLPFGAVIAGESTNLGGSGTKKRFTSYDRSNETSLDYAVNRQYSAAQGRFTQVDPISMSAVSLTNPQSLNLYAYCLNDPINYADPSGLFLPAAGAGALGGPIVAVIVLAVMAALSLLFGRRRTVAKMGTRIEHRLPPSETGSKIIWAKPSIRGSVGAVENYIGGDDPDGYRINEQGELVLVINTTEVDVGGPDVGWFVLGLEWLSGVGANHRVFGPNSSMTKGIRTSPEVDYHRDKFCKSNQTVYNGEARKFGIYGYGWPSLVTLVNPFSKSLTTTIGHPDTPSSDGILRAGGSMARQFVGSFPLKITRLKDGGALFEAYNETSTSSFFGGLTGNISPSDGIRPRYMETKSQTYRWKEDNPCGK